MNNCEWCLKDAESIVAERRCVNGKYFWDNARTLCSLCSARHREIFGQNSFEWSINTIAENVRCLVEIN